MRKLEFHGVEHLDRARHLTDAKDVIIRGQEVACWLQKTLEESPDSQAVLHMMVEQEILSERAKALLESAKKEKTPRAVGNYTRGKLGEQNLI